MPFDLAAGLQHGRAPRGTEPGKRGLRFERCSTLTRTAWKKPRRSVPMSPAMPSGRLRTTGRRAGGREERQHCHRRYRPRSRAAAARRHTIVAFGISTAMCVSTTIRVGSNVGYRPPVREPTASTAGPRFLQRHTQWQRARSVGPTRDALLSRSGRPRSAAKGFCRPLPVASCKAAGVSDRGMTFPRGVVPAALATPPPTPHEWVQPRGGDAPLRARDDA